MAEHILIADMASYTDRNGRDRLLLDPDEPFEVVITGTESDEGPEAKRPSKKLRHSRGSAESTAGGVASFTTNHNSVVCLPLVSEGLKLVWTQSDQTRELDSIPELVHAFNLFPYPSSKEVSTLARECVLPLDKVKVWFMVQRIKYGISWSSEEIEETRRKLTVPELCEDSAETSKDALKGGSKHYDELVIVDRDSGEEECHLISFVPETPKAKCESPASPKPTAPCFRSCLPPPQDSYFYRSPAHAPTATAAEVSPDLTECPSQQYRHGRYKKSKAQLAALRKSFLRENWPAEPELKRLQEETGLSRNDIRKWFSDSRYQLRVGRGSLAAAQTFSHQAAVGSKHEAQPQTQPLPLTSPKPRQVNGVKPHDGGRSNGIRNSHFFQTFLSNSLEAFGEKLQETQAPEVVEELSGDGDAFKEEELPEEEPLQLTTTCKVEPDVVELRSSPCSSPPPPTLTPPLAAPSHKPLSHRIRTSKKSLHSAKSCPSLAPACFSGASTSTSPALTPAGRPRKTKEQLDVLKQHFLKSQWPTSEEYTELVTLTGLPRADVIQWFGDTRYAVKNGQLRWVKGVREQFLAELAAQQGAAGLSNGTAASARGGGGRKRKLSRASTDSPDIQPLVSYYLTTGTLNEKDLDLLCKKSRMSYQQVRDWFATQEVGETDEEIVVT
ncbi:homeobox and leucine zipper encoding a [Fundulus heteroclitus]|uniref:homeobox and leucine zipper encoding a n=1 Tax=Fundulus heteroclitus TaxID=8078 RepID=UPI00165AC5C2|nr:homeobox and leucine zipper encoding a [Fundulus heteroclitus]